MKFLKGRWAVVVVSGLMVVSFQNCSQIGHNDVAFQGESLELTSEMVIPPAQALPVEVSTPGKGPEKTPENTPAQESAAESSAVVSDSEIAEIVAVCRMAEQTSGFCEKRSIKLVHETFDSITHKVSALSLVQSRGVLRASGSTSSVAAAQAVHSDLVLCGFSQVGNIQSTHSRVFVVGGTVEEAKLVHSSLILINAELKSHSGVNSAVKSYSLQ